MQKKRLHVVIRHCLLLSLLVLLLPGGCLDIFQKRKEAEQENAVQTTAPRGDSKVLISMKGSPLVTEKDVDEKLQEIETANPGLKDALMFMGPQIKHMIADQMMLNAVVERYIREQNIDQKGAYKQALDAAIASARETVNQQFFVKQLDVSVSDRELHNYYEKEKENFLLSQGGRKTKGIMLGDAEQARSFAKKAKSAKGDLMKAAEADNALKDKVRDFGLVHEKSIGVESSIRNAVSEVTSHAPTIKTISDEKGNSWVLEIGTKEEKQYHSFETLKEQIRQELEKRKIGEESAKFIKNLSEKYGIEDHRERPQMEMACPDDLLPNEEQEDTETAVETP